jgi:hypothetical protein
MSDAFVSHIFSSQWLVLVSTALLLLGGGEVGYRFGLRLFAGKDEARKCQIGGVQGATLGLLGLLLGFTFAMAIERFNVRQQLVIAEANAIETTYLHAAFLPDARRAEVEALLRRYADLRVEFYDVLGDQSRLADVDRKATVVREEIWAQTVSATKNDPALSPLVEHFINAFTETNRLCAMRTAAIRNRVPGAVWMLVMLMSCVGCAVTGYAAGAAGKRAVVANLLLPILVSVVITILVDFSRPQDGLTGINQSSMVALREKLRARQN